MKKLLTLLAVATVVTSVTGCGCCRRLRDVVCRGSRCGAPAALAASPAPIMPMMQAPPMAACPTCPTPMAYDPGCSYNPGVQTYGYGSMPSYDSGWTEGCSDCSSGSYSMPQYGGNGYLADPGDTMTAPGPAPLND